MQLNELPFGTNIKIPEQQQDGGYKLADYTFGCLNNFGIGTAGLVRKDIHSKRKFGGNTNYVGSELDKCMHEVYASFPAELQLVIIPATFNLETADGGEEISRYVFAPTLSMTGMGYNDEGLTWPIFNTYDNRVKKYNGSAAYWWLASRRNSSFVWLVYSDGSSYYYNPSYTYGVAPAFTIPQSLEVEEAPNGGYGLKILQDYYRSCN